MNRPYLPARAVGPGSAASRKLRLPIPRHNEGRGIFASQWDRFLKVFWELRPALSVEEDIP